MFPLKIVLKTSGRWFGFVKPLLWLDGCVQEKTVITDDSAQQLSKISNQLIATHYKTTKTQIGC